MTDLKKLRELAEKATFTKVDSTDSYSDLWLCYATEPDTSSGEFIAEFASKADADYFAAANPETVIALLDRIEKLEKALDITESDLKNKMKFAAITAAKEKRREISTGNEYIAINQSKRAAFIEGARWMHGIIRGKFEVNHE